MHDHDVGRFDRWSSRYDRSILQPLLFAPVQVATLAEAQRELRDVRAVLDVGCGTGQLLRRAAVRFPGAELVGADPAPGMLERARESPKDEIEFVNAAAEKLPFPDARFDLVVTTLSFHHWADQQQGLREVRRVLRDEGLFVLTDGSVPGWLRWAFAFRRGGGRLQSPEALDDLLAKAGLRTISRGSVPWRRQIQFTLARPA
ncbi:MAG TPA: class I SAM-dependent methyltransferase [Acidimicrobiales bacterium]|nr:class I SAM-dependent methyltransferase [Acidimicrobiales bacterium]